MALVTQCENVNCQRIEGDPDHLIDWIQVGFVDSEPYDACSLSCARAILDNQIAEGLREIVEALANTGDKEPAE